MQQMSESLEPLSGTRVARSFELVVEDDAEEVDKGAPGSLTECGSVARAALVSSATGVNGLLSSSASDILFIFSKRPMSGRNALHRRHNPIQVAQRRRERVSRIVKGRLITFLFVRAHESAYTQFETKL